MNDQSVSQWLQDLKEGDDVAAQNLWERYFEQLVVFARRKLAGVPRALDDEEDIALSAFGSFCRQATAGRFPQLQDRDDLWKLLFTITDRKLINHHKYTQRQKRGAGKVITSLDADDDRSGPGMLAQHLLAREPSPEFVATMAEEVRGLLRKLGDNNLSQIAIMKMEGYTNAEIAKSLDTSKRTIIRKLQVIRSIWTHA